MRAPAATGPARPEALPGQPASADPEACLHESLRGWWRLAEFVPEKRGDRRAGRGGRRVYLFRRRDPPSAPHVHDVAFLCRGYWPLS